MAEKKRAAAKDASARTRSRSSQSRKTAAASKNRKTSGSTAAKKTSRKQLQAPSPKRQEPVDYKLYVEIFLWIIIGLTVLILISLFGFGGPLGAVLRNVVFGLFGTMAYIFPFFMLFLISFLISNKGKPRALIKAAGALGIFFTLCGFM